MSLTARALVVAALALSACAPTEHEELEACEHLADGPARSLTAVSEGEGPALSDDHTRYDVTLTAITGGNGGQVHLAADAAAEYGFYLSAEVPLAITDADGNPVTLEQKPLPEDACSELALWVAADLTVGTWVLRFGPTAQGSVSVVVEAEEEGHSH